MYLCVNTPVGVLTAARFLLETCGAERSVSADRSEGSSVFRGPDKPIAMMFDCYDEATVHIL